MIEESVKRNLEIMENLLPTFSRVFGVPHSFPLISFYFWMRVQAAFCSCANVRLLPANQVVCAVLLFFILLEACANSFLLMCKKCANMRKRELAISEPSRVC